MCAGVHYGGLALDGLEQLDSLHLHAVEGLVVLCCENGHLVGRCKERNNHLSFLVRHGEDIEQLVDAFTSLFAAMRDLKALVKNPVDPKPVTRMARNDDQILADFVSLFN
jgi:hypothetical protein